MSGRAGAARWGGRLPWLIAGAAVIGVALLLMLPRETERAGPPAMTGPDAPGAGAPFAGSAPGGAGAPPPLSGDMRVDADRLFNRVMTARQQGDSAEAARFTPMAVQAYGMVEDLDADGLYHLALIHLTAGDYSATQQTAARILETAPDHVLALGVAGAAAAGAGDGTRAADLYARLLDAYPTEAARDLPEYADHQPMLPEYRRAAREYLGDADG
ncbi:MAG TPA: hypothetical protein VMM83_00800 [Longimicrobiales bacterium]|nr:hypothetical protein [Longimicrobiales bacterium]